MLLNCLQQMQTLSLLEFTCEQLKEFIKSKGVKVTEIELISNAPERRTNNFRVAIKAADYDKAMQPEVCTYRVGVRRFIPKRLGITIC